MGKPVTSGNPAIDYYVSGDRLEHPRRTRFIADPADPADPARVRRRTRRGAVGSLDVVDVVKAVAPWMLWTRAPSATFTRSRWVGGLLHGKVGSCHVKVDPMAPFSAPRTHTHTRSQVVELAVQAT